jgi:transposase
MYEEINEFIQKLIIEIPEIKIYKWEKDEDGAVHFYGELIIEKVYCPNCNSITKNVVKYYPRKVRHSPICEKPTYLHFEMREYQCEKCGSCFRQPLQFLSLYKHFTNDYINYIKKLLKETNIAWVARFENLEYHIVKRIAEKEIPASIKDNTDNLEKISIDEISQKKGYKDFRTIISDLKIGKIVDILKDRTKETVKEWFKNLGKEKQE